jgi:holo-[acyl-carrier protein] synthase
MASSGPERGVRLASGSILGLGFDLVEVSRIERAVARWGEAFLTYVFTDREVKDCGAGRGRFQRLAVRFCAKEAVFKALGRGRPALGWLDVEVVRMPSGRPEVVLGGKALEFARLHGVASVLVTLSHTQELAAAQALCLAGERPGDGRLGPSAAPGG